MKKILLGLSSFVILLGIGFGFFYYYHFVNDHSKMDHSKMITGEESFLKLMVEHHKEAINTSKIVLDKTNNEDIKILLENIIRDQENEVYIMNEIIKNFYDNGKSFDYKEMMDPNLDSYDSIKAEKVYLEGMIIHHKGAIQKAKKMLEFEMTSETRKIVDNIISSQQSEIDYMRELLKNY